MRRSIAAGLVIFAMSASLAPHDATAIEPGSAACKKELQAAEKKMRESIALVDRGKAASGPARCEAISHHIELSEQIRESFARCEEPKARTSAVRDADDVLEASNEAYKKWCPPRPGMVRVKVTMVTRVTRDKLPKPLAPLHRCVDSGDMYSANERFDLGRLMTFGCPGNPSPTSEQIKERNTRAELLRQEQVAFYLTRDRDGDDPRRLSFPIFTADGREAATDVLVAGRNHIGDKLDLIESFWEPAKEGVCRVHVLWRVTDGKAALVLWQEAADCASGKVEFKTVLDRQ